MSPETKFSESADALSRKRIYLFAFSLLALLFLTVFGLRSQDRIWWCKFNDYSPWSSDAWGKHNSQHLFDPYSFTHVLHGVLYFWIAGLIFRKLSFAWRFLIAVFAECAWEIFENTNFVIERYRAATLALDYYGDSVFNSLGDIFCCAFGFWLAAKLKFWRSFALFLLIELVLLITIHDSLLLNIVMLIYPFEAVKQWQNY
jgi:hypothetical protein